MPIEIANIQLNRIHHLATLEQAQWVMHTIPGREGTVAQDLGRGAVRLDIRGICYGTQAQADLERLRQVYKQREAVDFLAEIVGQAYFSRVIIEQFEVLQQAIAPGEYSYRLIVTEFMSTPAPARGAEVNQAIQGKAAGFMTTALLPDALQMGALPEISNPIQPLKTALNPIQEATQGMKAVTTDLQALLGL